MVGSDQSFPISRGHLVVLFGGKKGIDATNDNVDVEVHLEDGTRWGATFFTLENLRTLLESYRGTGEGAGGLYVWSSGMIVVRDLHPDSIVATVEDLIATGELTGAFERLEE